MSRRSSDRNRFRAFTLIELLVVIIIIAVMAATVVPAYARFAAKARFDAVTRQVQDVFAFAREQAVATATPVTLVFNPQADAFTVTVPPPLPQSDQPVALAAEDAQNAQKQDNTRVVALDEHFTLANAQFGQAADPNSNNAGGGNGSPQVVFRPDGTCDGAEFTIVSADGYTAHLVALPATAHLRLLDTPASQAAPQ